MTLSGAVRLRSVCALLVILCLGVQALSGAGAWRRLPPVPRERLSWRIEDFAVESSGIPWVVTRANVYWLKGDDWQALAGKEIPHQKYRSLFGGPKRGVFLSCHDCGPGPGKVFRLEDGGAREWCEFTPCGSLAGLYVSRKGELFNLATTFTAVWKDRAWLKTEVPGTAVINGNMHYAFSINDFGPDGPVVFTALADGAIVVWDGTSFSWRGKLPDQLPKRGSRSLRTCPWGKDRILYWRFHERGLAVAELGDQGARAIDIAGLMVRFGPVAQAFGAVGLPDGSCLFQFARKYLGRKYLVRLHPDGTVQELPVDILGREDSLNLDRRESVLLDRLGGLWLGVPRGGILWCHDDKVRPFDWRSGVTSEYVNWLFEAHGGRILAAGSHDMKIYEWVPDGEPDRSLAEGWGEITAIHRPAADLRGGLWAFRPDRPGAVSYWDGETWQDFSIDFTPDRDPKMVTDGLGRLIVTSYRGPAHVVGGERVVKLRGVREALADRARAGAKEFMSEDFRGAVVTPAGDIWFQFCGTSTLHSCVQGSWSEQKLKVRAMWLDESDRPVLVTGKGMLTHTDGRLAEVPRKEERPLEALSLVERTQLPWLGLALPKPVRSRYTVVERTQGGGGRPISWRRANAILNGQFGEALKAPRRSMSGEPEWAVRDAKGGGWVATNRSKVYRWLADELIEIDKSLTPIQGKHWLRAGLTAKEVFWIEPYRYQAKHHIFFRKPSVSKSDRLWMTAAEQIDGGHLRFTWEPRSPDHRAVFWKTNLDKGWRALQDCSAEYTLAAPEGRRLKVETRVMDSLGILGPPAADTVEFQDR